MVVSQIGNLAEGSLYVQFLESYRGRSVVTEMKNRCSRRREGEILERFGEHFVQVVYRGKAGGNVELLVLAGILGHIPRCHESSPH